MAVSRKQGLEALESELAGEKVSSLRRIAGVLEEQLVQLASLESAPLAAERDTRLKALRRKVQRQLWYLIVQREAMGLRDHRDVYVTFRIPSSIVPEYTPEDLEQT